ncbi:hypothetical protein GCM10011492_10650 [Flexivirga endophytica]|uniref:DUF721 domain-containing protein n=1 Tax=Flexivirga endophytica TaxID=1849103 RepID=A0A916SXX7_9MICO|nr:DciA family protein [Flexivirga endophytica]GGB22713.1 hypothetical protein GCM10011492_10650 [Flexivirga endophytica]GHB56633.1 hypothetical protein GCM10008112_27190 [Flexivirga endophytica]
MSDTDGVDPGETERPADDTDGTVDQETAMDAVRDALRRARISAREKGFRPGAPARRRPRKAGDLGTGRARPDARDPAMIGDQLDRLLVDRGWQVDVAAGSVMGRWDEIVGEAVAAHAQPVSFTDGELTVRADSTAWTTQLRLLSSTLLGNFEKAVGPDVVESLRIVGPNAPSWKKGPRTVRDGRGPRDTYG